MPCIRRHMQSLWEEEPLEKCMSQQHSHHDRRYKEDSRKLGHQKKKKSRNINEFGNSYSEKTNSSDSDEQFDCVQISVLSRTTRKEAFTNLRIRLPHKKGKHKLKLKIDRGAAGNTLPVRTIRQMYGDKYKGVIQRAHNIRLTAYNGQDIPCLGIISISIKKAKKLHTCQILRGGRTWTSNSGSAHMRKTGTDHDQLQCNEKRTSSSTQRPNR